MIDRLTQMRLATVVASGFENEADMGKALLESIAEIGADVLARDHISDEQRAGVQIALKDAPIAFSVLTSVINDLGFPEEQRLNLRFMLIKLMDDLLSLGSVAMLGKEMQVGFSVLAAASSRGIESGRIRREKSELAWKIAARQMAKQIRDREPGLSQDDLATEIAARWKGKRVPGHTSLKNLIMKMEREGGLPRAVRPTKSVRVAK